MENKWYTIIKFGDHVKCRHCKTVFTLYELEIMDEFISWDECPECRCEQED